MQTRWNSKMQDCSLGKVRQREVFCQNWRFTQEDVDIQTRFIAGSPEHINIVGNRFTFCLISTLRFLWRSLCTTTKRGSWKMLVGGLLLRLTALVIAVVFSIEHRTFRSKMNSEGLYRVLSRRSTAEIIPKYHYVLYLLSRLMTISTPQLNIK